MARSGQQILLVSQFCMRGKERYSLRGTLQEWSQNRVTSSTQFAQDFSNLGFKVLCPGKPHGPRQTGDLVTLNLTACCRFQAQSSLGNNIRSPCWKPCHVLTVGDNNHSHSVTPGCQIEGSFISPVVKSPEAELTLSVPGW